jgi:prevent-host-death family protein
MGTVIVSVAEAGRRLSQLVSTAESGTEVIITRRGAPAARITAAKGDASGNGRTATEVLAGRLARRTRWATPQQVEETIAAAGEGWDE